MATRTVILIVALAFIVFFGLLTASEVVSQGVTPAVVISLVILALFAFGIVGALRGPPPE